MKYFLSLVVISAMFFPMVAKADIAPDPGFHEVVSCAYFDNLDEFPNYDVYTSYGWRFRPSAMLASSADTIATSLAGTYGCSQTDTPFFAINQNNQSSITHETDPYGEQGDMWYSLEQNQQYFIPAVVSGTTTDFSDQLVHGNMPDSNPAVSFVNVYHIDKLTDTAFEARLVSESTYDENDKLISQTTDQSSALTKKVSLLPYCISAGAIIIGIGLLTFVWKRNCCNGRKGKK